MAQERTLWGIHAGRIGEAEHLFESKGVVAIGWKDMGDLAGLVNREDFKNRYAEAYPDEVPGAIPVKAGQLFRFVREMRVGDIVVFPLKSVREIWLGEVTGEYQHAPEIDASFPQTRRVKWLKKFPRTHFSQGALYEIGSSLTFFQVKNFADEFMLALEGKEFRPPTEKEEEEAIGLVADDIERQSRDFVLKQLSGKLKGHGLSHLVGHLLELMGYKTRVSPPGPDRGIDIEAHKDDLGVAPPTILVQVKSSDTEVSEADVQRLYGNVSEREFGLFVALGGFKKRAREFAYGKHNLKLVDGDELVELIYKYYERLDGKYKGLIPLRRVFLPETLAE